MFERKLDELLIVLRDELKKVHLFLNALPVSTGPFLIPVHELLRFAILRRARAECLHISRRPLIVGLHKFLGSKNRHKLAGFHEGDARGKSECFVKIVRDKEYGFLQTLLQRLEFSLQLISGERIEST